MQYVIFRLVWLYVNVLINVCERTVQCRRAGWCWWLLVDVLLSPFCGLNDGSRTESPQRSTGKVPPLHQRRRAAETDLTQSPVRNSKTHTCCHLPVTLQNTDNHDEHKLKFSYQLEKRD